MPTLRKLQQRFAAALFDDRREALNEEICADGIDVSERIAIYRNQLHAVFTRTLGLEFPVIEQLVGGGFFRRLGTEFQAAHPSRAGDLQHIGAPFAAYLKERFRGGAYDYLADVAALEWALQECMVAPEMAAFDPQVLRGIDAADYAQLHFAMNPACRLVSSAYPVLAIWRANQPGAATSEIIDLANGPTRVLMQRSAQSVEFHSLTLPEFSLLDALARDFCLGDALEAALRCDAAFDLGAALRRFVTAGALTAAAVPQLPRNPLEPL
jgi:hypothetical protein